MFIIIDQEFFQAVGHYGPASIASVVPTAEKAGDFLWKMYGLSYAHVADHFLKHDKAPYRVKTPDQATAVSVFQRGPH